MGALKRGCASATFCSSKGPGLRGLTCVLQASKCKVRCEVIASLPCRCGIWVVSRAVHMFETLNCTVPSQLVNWLPLDIT